jgi:hypothetical protein
MSDAAEFALSPETIKNSGWRQGCIIPADLYPDLAAYVKIEEITKNADAFIVVSHDCDVTHCSFENEPYVELLAVKKVSGLNGLFTLGKSPRRLHFEIDIPGIEKQSMEAFAYDRLLVPRKLLIGKTPDSQHLCSPQTINQIKEWLSRRYHRVAFPDSFNNRIKPAQDKIKKELKKEGGIYISGLYFVLEMNELPEAKNYQITIVATMRVEDYEDATRRNKSQAVFDRIEAFVSECEGIEVTFSELKGEDQVSLDDLLYLTRWDSYDYLSPED